MAGIYSACLVHARLVGPATVFLYEVPAGLVAVVRDITMYMDYDKPAGGLAGVSIIPEAGSSEYNYIHLQADMVPGVLYHWTGRQVLPAGAQILGVVLSDSMNLRVSGYLLQAS